MGYVFGDYDLDLDLGELLRDGNPVDVPPKALSLLRYLIDRRERVVSKDELLGALWPNQALGDGVLKRAVHSLRVAVGDDGATQSVIQTRARLGYRFVAELVDTRPAELESAKTIEPGATTASDFVGRARSFGDLYDAWKRAEAGRGGIALVAGSAGIGKTRLVEELAVRVNQDGGRLLRGWCDESQGAPPYWPWLQIARKLDLRVAAELAAVDTHDALNLVTDEIHGRASQNMFSKRDLLTRALIEASQTSPILLVLEDLHWGDHATLGVLAFAARQIADAPILVVATFRDDELSPDHFLVRNLRTIVPRDSDLRIHLQGLTTDEIRMMLTNPGGTQPSPETVSAIHSRTAGNPLFVKEISRLISSKAPTAPVSRSLDQLDEIPLGAMGVLKGRILQLTESSRSLLEKAALIGLTFDRHLLGALSSETAGAVSDALESARMIGVVRSGRDNPTEWEFTHALMRDALLAGMPASRRLELHQRLLSELESRFLPDPGPSLSRLADHANAIQGAGGSVRQAFAYDRLAAWHAAARYAYEDCVAHAERALNTLRSLESREYVEPELSTELRIELAHARNMLMDFTPAIENAEEAARLAYTNNDAAALARAALAVFIHAPADADLVKRSIRLLDLAEENAIPGSASSIRLLSARVMQLSGIPETALRRVKDSHKALGWARELGDHDTFACALSANLRSNWSQHDPDLRLSYARELCSDTYGISDRIDDSELLLTALLEHGDLDGWEESIRKTLTRVTAVSAGKYYGHYEPLYAGTRALWRGELGAAEAFIEETHEYAKTTGPLWLSRAHAVQLSQLRIDRGQLAEVEIAARAARSVYPNEDAYSAVLAFALCEQGRNEEARPIFEAVVDNFDYGSDVDATTTLTVLATVCSSLSDKTRARRLYSQLQPLGNFLSVSVGCWICQGSIQWPLGLLAWTAGESAVSERHLESAVSRADELGMRAYQARAILDLATLLAQDPQPESQKRARSALDSASNLAHSIGMPVLIARGEELNASLST